MQFHQRILLGVFAGAMIGGAQAATTTINMYAVDSDGVSDPIGSIKAEQSEYGVVFTPDLKNLDEGPHGFHLHQNPSCEPAKKDGDMAAAVAAGGHYDPDKAGHHGTPWGEGHLGDLPALYVNDDGQAVTPVLAPRLEMSDLKGRAVMIHEGGDNYSDQPKPLGGGGARVACGIIK
ncbi:superoxide dismutase [Cu-Zn] SodC [Alloalcanivorax mobilis]|uniref:superoxide dismutase [Cu-Zn] SodC n=1 Tax=Alloalcanivorax mobilis TaxID=2019569 RepID=UPI002100DB94|nr:superoxide dismutase [Cu-Zn] SodC [Alloalcanivorax mobilis]